MSPPYAAEGALNTNTTALQRNVEPAAYSRGGGLKNRKTEISDGIRTLISLLIDDDSLVSPAGKMLDLGLVHVADRKTLNADQLTARLG